MSDIPAEFMYTKSHEWVRKNDDGSLTVGISDHAQELMGDMVYIELPEVGASLEAGSDCAVVESVKAASDIYAPVSGEVIEANEKLGDNPEIVNKEPFGDGWMFRMQPSDEAELEVLMNAKDYETLIASEEA